MTIYSEKIDEFISQLENEMIEINLDIRKLETEKQVYQKILDDLRELVERYYNDGQLKEKDYLKYKGIVQEYTTNMKNYHH